MACPLPPGAVRVSLLPFLQGGTYAILTAAAGGEGAPAGDRLAAGGSKGGSPQCGPTNPEPQTDASRYEGMLSPLHALTLSADKRAQAPPSHPNPNPNPNPSPNPTPHPHPNPNPSRDQVELPSDVAEQTARSRPGPATYNTPLHLLRDSAMRSPRRARSSTFASTTAR